MIPVEWLTPAAIAAVVTGLTQVGIQWLKGRRDAIRFGFDEAEDMRTKITALVFEEHVAPLQRRVEQLEADLAVTRDQLSAAVEAVAEADELRTNLQKAHEELDDVYELLRDAKIGVGVIGTDFRYHYINGIGADMNGVPRDETMGYFVEHCLPHLWPDIRPQLERVFAGETVKGLLSTQGPNGEDQDWEYVYRPVWAMPERDRVLCAYVEFRLLDADALKIARTA